MVDKLNRNLRTLVMHPVGQLAEPREIPVVGDRHLMRRSGSARVGDCTHFSDQESGAAAGPLFVVADNAFPHLAIVVPGNMLKEAYEERGLAPENLSRTLEDTGTVTSVLIPWNTCGVAQSGILGVSTWAYLPYCIFNWISPLTTLTVAALGWNIRKHEGAES